jgi:hypothetical protein
VALPVVAVLTNERESFVSTAITDITKPEELTKNKVGDTIRIKSEGKK